MSSETFQIEVTDEWKNYVDFIPEGYDALGVVSRHASERGALIQHLKTGNFYFFTRHSHRSLPKEEILEALKQYLNREVF
jgi:hypothetical protein